MLREVSTVQKQNHLFLSHPYTYLAALSLLPVPFSPVSSKASRNDPLDVRPRIRASIKTVAENHRKWTAAQRRGNTLCASIENIKSHAIKASAQASGPGDSQSTLYPTELKSVCEKLRIITTIFEDVLESARESCKQIETAILLGAANVFAEQTIALKTWPCQRIVECLNKIIECYELEYSVKINCMQNIAHAKTKEQLVLHTCAWEFATYVTDDDVALPIAQMVADGDIELSA